MRKAVEPVADNTVLLSIHDISPVHEDDVVRTYDLLSNLGISSLTLLVTPFYAMRKANSFTKGSLFSEFLLSLNLEISLHGYSRLQAPETRISSIWTPADRREQTYRLPPRPKTPRWTARRRFSSETAIAWLRHPVYGPPPRIAPFCTRRS